MLSLYFISHVTCVMSFNSKYPRLLAHWLVPHMSMFVAVVMFITIGSIKTKCLYHEACVDAASADQYVTFSPPFSFVFAYDIFALLLAHYRQSQYGGWHKSSPSVGTSAKCRPCQWGWWHSVVSVSRDVGHVSSLSMRMVAQRCFCQYGWWHSVVYVSMDGGTVSYLSMGMMAQCRFCQYGWRHSVVSVSGDDGTVSFLSVGMVAQCRFCQ
jgi:hypothetical protein